MVHAVRAITVFGFLLLAGAATAQAPLEVPGFAPASHGTPDRDGVRPVVVVLHGNFDRPEWECGVWKPVAAPYGWVLCPRGLARKDIDPSLDRWTYGSRKRTLDEVDAALAALEAKYPGRVTREGMVLAGFSLGAIMAPDIVVEAPDRFRYLFLVEGGLEKLQKRSPAVLRKAGVLGVGFAMSAGGRRKRAARWVERYRAVGLRAELVDMEGAGHGYSDDFSQTGRAAFARLTRPDEP